MTGRGALRWTAALTAAAAVGIPLQVAHPLVDLGVYRFGGRTLLHGGRLYDLVTPGTHLAFTYTPFAALLMVPVSLLPGWLAAGLWSAAGLAALIWTLRLFRDARPGPIPGPALQVLLVLVALALEPVVADVRAGQVDLFVMLAISVDVLGPDRRWSGVALGVAAGVKLTPLVFVVLLVLVARRASAARAAATFAATIALSFAVAPADARDYWTRAVWDTSRVGRIEYVGNQSVQGMLDRLGGHQPATLLWLAVAGGAALAALLVAAAWWRRGDRDLATCLGAVAMLLASPVSWNHHWVWAAPITLVLLRVAPRWITAAWVFVFVSHLPFWPPHADGREWTWSAVEQVAGNAYVWAGLLLVAGAAGALWRSHQALPERGGATTVGTSR